MATVEAISDARANDERVICLRIFADADGESHMEDISIGLQPKQLFKRQSTAASNG
jgi:hypothetical protein